MNFPGWHSGKDTAEVQLEMQRSLECSACCKFQKTISDPKSFRPHHPLKQPTHHALPLYRSLKTNNLLPGSNFVCALTIFKNSPWRSVLVMRPLKQPRSWWVLIPPAGTMARSSAGVGKGRVSVGDAGGVLLAGVWYAPWGRSGRGG